jgi:hypothetical protein
VNGALGWLLTDAVLLLVITGLAVSEARRWLRDRRLAARASETARLSAELESDPSGEKTAAYIASLREWADV